MVRAIFGFLSQHGSQVDSHTLRSFQYPHQHSESGGRPSLHHQHIGFCTPFAHCSAPLRRHSKHIYFLCPRPTLHSNDPSRLFPKDRLTLGPKTTSVSSPIIPQQSHCPSTINAHSCFLQQRQSNVLPLVSSPPVDRAQRLLRFQQSDIPMMDMPLVPSKAFLWIDISLLPLRKET